MLSRYRRFRNRYNSDLPRYRAIVDMTPIGPVLDFGCGRGYLGKMLQEKGCTVTGCDISPESDQCTFPVRKMDLNGATDFEENEFDSVVASDVLEHLQFPEAALAEMARIARRFVIISVPNSRGYLLYRVLPSLENPNEWCGPHLHHWSRRTFPMPDLPLVDLTYSTDLPELRFLNLLRWGPLSQTIIMKFATGGEG
jgi:SAM-dependent methyltransferase